MVLKKSKRNPVPRRIGFKEFAKPLEPREKRILVYLAVALLIVGVDYIRRYWSPDFIQESEHYIILSTG